MNRSELGMPVEIHRAVPSESFRFYDPFTQRIRDTLIDFPRWHNQEYNFGDGSPYFRLMRPEGVDQTVKPYFIVPLWVVPPMEKSLFNLKCAINALTRINEGTGQRVSTGVTVLAPYMELRMDKASINNFGETNEGEAATAEIIADGFRGATNVVGLMLHSHEAQKAFKKIGIEAINVSPIPLFIQEAKEAKIISDKTVVVASDFGSLQACLEFAEQCGLDIEKQIVVFDKGARDQDSQAGILQLVYGENNLHEDSLVIQIDDIHDSGGSVDKVENFLVGRGVKNIFQFFGHGVFSHPADINVRKRLGRNKVKGVWVTDSLPQASYRLDADPRIHKIEVAPLLALVAATAVDCSLKELSEFHLLKNYLMVLKDKKQVWRDFCNQVGHNPDAQC